MTQTESTTTIYLSNLKASCSRLAELMQKNRSEQSRIDIIRCFDFCYKLSYKTMQDFLNSSGVGVSHFDVLRESEKTGLIKDVNLWLNFLEKKESIVYAYNGNVMREIMAVIPGFELEMEKLIKVLEKKV